MKFLIIPEEKKIGGCPILFDYVVPADLTFDEIAAILGRQYKSTLLNWEVLFKFIKGNMEGEIVCISSTAKHLVKVFKHHQHVSRALARLKTINVLSKASDFSSKGEYGLCYAVNEHNLDLILEFIKKNKVSNKNEVNELVKEYNNEPKSNPIYPIDFRKIKKKELPQNISDFDVFVSLVKKYPQLLDYQDIVMKLNKEMEEKHKITFEPTIERKNGFVSNIGIRASAPFMCRKSKEKAIQRGEKLKDDKSYREDELDIEFGKGWQEYDVKGSVPRISHLMKTGEWLAPEVDPYKIMFEDVVDEWNEQNRNQMKQWFMRLYFTDSVAEIVRNAIFDKKIPDATTENKAELTAWVRKAKQRVIDFCGETDNTAVFLHESCIYLDVREELFKREIDVRQVYDGFYFASGTMPRDMAEIIEQAAKKYYLKILKSSKKTED